LFKVPLLVPYDPFVFFLFRVKGFRFTWSSIRPDMKPLKLPQDDFFPPLLGDFLWPLDFFLWTAFDDEGRLYALFQLRPGAFFDYPIETDTSSFQRRAYQQALSVLSKCPCNTCLCSALDFVLVL